MKTKLTMQFAAGLAAGMILAASATAAAATKIISAEYNAVSVSVNGEAVTLDAPLISVVDEAAPTFDVNYMPLRTVLEGLGYTVTWQGETQNVELTKPEAAVSAAPEQKTAKLTLDGVSPDYATDITVAELPGENGTELFVPASALLNALATADVPYKGEYDAATNTFAITGKAPFTGGKPIREVLDATGSKYDVQTDGGFITVALELGTAKATATIPMEGQTGPASVTCGDKSAEFQFYIAEGRTLVVEESFIKALTDVGFMK